MALEIMDMLVSFLCPTSSAASQCQSFIGASNHQVLAPFGPMIYFLFFPIIFLLLFIYILSSLVLRKDTASIKGVRLLIGIGLLVWIVINGMYPIFLWLGELWFVVIFILGFFYFIAHHFNEDKGGGGGMRAPGGGGGEGSLSNTVKGMLSGDLKTRTKDVKDRIEELKKAAHNLDSATPGSDAAARALDQFRIAEREAMTAAEELKKFNTRFPIPGSKGRSIIKFSEHYENEIRSITQRERKKAA